MNKRHFLALGLIALLSSASYFLLNEHLKTEKTNTARINISEYQCMLTQRIAYYSTLLLNSREATKQDEYRDKLRVLADSMEEAQNTLFYSDNDIRLPDILPPGVSSLYFDQPSFLDERVRNFVDHTRALADTPYEELSRNNPHFTYIKEEASEKLLKSMDEAIKLYQMANDANFASLQNMTAVIVALIILVLAMIAVFIFRPIVIRLKKEIRERNKAEAQIKRRDEYSQLMQEITATCNDYSTVDEVMQVFLDKICAYTGWPVGHIYIPDSSGKLLPSKIWHIEEPERFEMFRKVTEETVFEKGEGLPGRVLESWQPVIMNDITKDPGFPRAKLLTDILVRAGFAFPLMSGNTVLAVFEFFSTQVAEMDQSPSDLTGFLTTRLEQVALQKQIEEKLTKYSKILKRTLYRAEDALSSITKPQGLMPYFVFSPAYRQSRAGGGSDNIRWLRFCSEHAGLYLHDVSGHDIEKVLLNIMATAIVDESKVNPSMKAVSAPSIFLNNTNERLLEYCRSRKDYVTAIYLLMNYEKRSIKLSIAGHPRPWLISPDEQPIQFGDSGHVLGKFKIKPSGEDRFTDTIVKLKKGQTMLIYSDGLMEQPDRDGVPFSRKFSSNIVHKLRGKTPNEAFTILKNEFESHVGGENLADDVTFVFIGARPEGEYNTFEFVPSPALADRASDIIINIHKTFTPDELNIHRKSKGIPDNGFNVIHNIWESYQPVTDMLLDNDWPNQQIDRVELAISEMVMNAIIHGNRGSDRHFVNISYALHEETLEVSVKDEGAGFDGNDLSQTFGDEDLLKICGRGLHMIKSNVDKMCFSSTGNTCWALFKKGGEKVSEHEPKIYHELNTTSGQLNGSSEKVFPGELESRFPFKSG